MKKLILTVAAGAMLSLAAPASAHDWRGGTSTRFYPPRGYGYHRPIYQRVNYRYTGYRPYYGQPIIVRQAPPYGWAWGNRRVYPSRTVYSAYRGNYGYYPGNYGYYPGYGQSGGCDHDQTGWWGGQRDSWNGWWGSNQGNHGNNHGSHRNHGNHGNTQGTSNVRWDGNHQQAWNGRWDRDGDND